MARGDTPAVSRQAHALIQAERAREAAAGRQPTQPPLPVDAANLMVWLRTDATDPIRMVVTRGHGLAFEGGWEAHQEALRNFQLRPHGDRDGLAYPDRPLLARSHPAAGTPGRRMTLRVMASDVLAIVVDLAVGVGIPDGEP